MYMYYYSATTGPRPLCIYIITTCDSSTVLSFISLLQVLEHFKTVRSPYLYTEYIVGREMRGRDGLRVVFKRGKGGVVAFFVVVT